MANVVNRRINIYIDQESALAAQKKLQAAFDRSSNRVKKLEAAGKDATAEIAKMGKLKGKLDEINGVVSGKLRPSFNLVKKTVADLRRELRGMSEDAPGYAAKFKKYEAANKQFQEMKKNIGGVRRGMHSLAQDIKGVALGVLVGNTIQGAIQQIGQYVSGIVRGNAKLSDSLADVRRVTGLTKNEVDELYASLRKLDTRTSNSGLLNIAVIAGKLGVEGVQNIHDFVEATDKLQVALGDELGSADEITTQLGKVINVYQKGAKVTGDSLLHIGNAVVDLANKGVATGGYIVDFTQRLAGLAGTADLALPSVLGLAAGLEESGQRVESSSTAVIKVMTKIAADVPAAAKIAGRSVEEFTKTLSEKPLEALLQYAQGLQQNKKGFAEIAASFKDAGETGARVITTLGVLGSKADFLRKKMNEAGNAIGGTNEIMDAFNLKNETLGAKLDKLGKKFYKLITSSGIKDFLTSLIGLTSDFIDILEDVGRFIKDNIVVFGLWTAAIVVNQTARLANIKSMIAAKIATIASTAAIKAQRLAMLAFAAVQAIVTLNFKKARKAFRLFAAAMGSNPLGAILVAAGALLLVLNQISKKNHELTSAQKAAADIQKKVADATADQIARIKTLTKLIKGNTTSHVEKRKALDQLIKISPKYRSALAGQYIDIVKLTTVSDKLVTSLRKQARAAAIASSVRALEAKKVKLEAQKNRLQTGPDNSSGISGTLSFLGHLIGIGKGTTAQQIRDTSQDLSNVNQELNYLYGLVKKNKKLQSQLIAGATGEKTPGGGGGANSPDDVVKGAEKLATDLKNIAANLANFNISQYEKQLIAANKKYDGLEARVNKYIKDEKARSKVLILIEKLRSQELQKIAQKTFEQGTKNKKTTKPSAPTDQITNQQIREETQRLVKSTSEYAAKVIGTRVAKLNVALMHSTGQEQLDNYMKLLDFREQKELASTELTEQEKQKIHQKYGQMRAEAVHTYYQNLTNTVKSWAGQVINIFSLVNEAKNNADQAELQKDRQKHDEKVKLLQQQLNRGRISQAQYNRQVAALDDKLDKKRADIQKRQFERNKKMQIMQAVMSGAEAVMSTLAARPGFLSVVSLGTFRAIQIALIAATTAAKIAAISKMKAPSYGRGGKLNGPSHQSSYRGLPVINPQTGRVQAYMEGDEGIVKKSAMRDRKAYTVSGTPSQIASSLNAMHGGVNWEAGATLTPRWMTAKPRTMNIPRVNESIRTTRYYAGGGVFDKHAAEQQSQQAQQVVVQGGFSPEQFNALMSALDKKLQAYVVLQDLNNQQDRMNDILDNATLR